MIACQGDAGVLQLVQSQLDLVKLHLCVFVMLGGPDQCEVLLLQVAEFLSNLIEQLSFLHLRTRLSWN